MITIRLCPTNRRRAERTDVADSAFTLEHDHSVLGHTTASEADYGTALCWAENAVGAQKAPCAFRDDARVSLINIRGVPSGQETYWYGADSPCTLFVTHFWAFLFFFTIYYLINIIDIFSMVRVHSSCQDFFQQRSHIESWSLLFPITTLPITVTFG